MLDPVMVATSGDKLLAEDAIKVLQEVLFVKSLIITPNLHEAALLLNVKVALTDDEMIEQGKALLKLGAKAVLMKGGHSDGKDSTDYLLQKDKITRYFAPRIQTNNSHGTGCTLSSAITAGLAKGLALEQAVSEAKIYITEAIIASDKLQIGAGKGPAHHFHKWW